MIDHAFSSVEQMIIIILTFSFINVIKDDNRAGENSIAIVLPPILKSIVLP